MQQISNCNRQRWNTLTEVLMNTTHRLHEGKAEHKDRNNLNKKDINETREVE